MTIRLRESDGGVILPIKVLPGSRVAGVRGEQNGLLKVSVTVAPEKGKANKAVIKLLADALGIPKSSIEIISGMTSSQKQVLVAGVTLDELRERLPVK